MGRSYGTKLEVKTSLELVAPHELQPIIGSNRTRGDQFGAGRKNQGILMSHANIVKHSFLAACWNLAC